MIHDLQLADAGFLIGLVFCTIVVLQRDLRQASLFLRSAIVLFMIAAWGQAMWLLGVWEPSDAGFPWPRTVFDGSLFLTTLARVLSPEKSRWLVRGAEKFRAESKSLMQELVKLKGHHD